MREPRGVHVARAKQLGQDVPRIPQRAKRLGIPALVRMSHQHAVQVATLHLAKLLVNRGAPGEGLGAGDANTRQARAN